MPRPHPAEFRQRAIELVRGGDLPISKVAVDLGISDSCLRGWIIVGKTMIAQTDLEFYQ